MNTTDSQVEDIWSIGTLFKPGIWFYYIFANFVGVLLCSTLIYYVIKNKERNPFDIFAVGLCSGCFTMSLTCGIQCLLNMIYDERFFGADIACKIEAVAHISAIVVQFMNTMCMSLSIYYKIIRNKELEQKTAIRIVTAIWILCTLVTGLLSYVSPLYLVSSGTYCFFKFKSPAVAGWLLPVLIVSLSVMITCHIKIIKHFTRIVSTNANVAVTMGVQHKSFVTTLDIWKKQFKLKSTIFIILLLFGWAFFCLPTTIYELFVGEAKEWLVTGVGVGGVTYSAAISPAYAYTSTYYMDEMIKLFHRLTCFLCYDMNKKWRRSRQSLGKDTTRKSSNDSDSIASDQNKTIEEEKKDDAANVTEV